MAYPHPVLCGPMGPIRHLPDQMHEGMCEVPSDLTRIFTVDDQDLPDYPPLADWATVLV